MKFSTILLAALLAVSGIVQAQSAPAAPGSPTAATPQSDGEVRKIDKEQGKVTLRHGPLAKLEMPGMMMVFKVADPKMLDALKEGDKVKFTAERVSGAITVTAIQAAP